MTREEMQKKSADKRKVIERLCKQLEVEVSAKQMVTADGFIETVILYLDKEAYEPDEEIKEEKTNEKTTNLRK